MSHVLAHDVGWHPYRLVGDFQQRAVPVHAVNLGRAFHGVLLRLRVSLLFSFFRGFPGSLPDEVPAVWVRVPRQQEKWGGRPGWNRGFLFTREAPAHGRAQTMPKGLRNTALEETG